MRVIKGLDHKEVCGISILVPVGEESADFSKLISLNLRCPLETDGKRRVYR